MARILLADDDAATRDLVRRALEADGHSVLVTQDGNEALDRRRRGGQVRPSRQRRGDADARRRRAGAARLKQPGLRVLLMSGFAEQLDRAKALKGAHVAVLSKPFTLDQVRASVRKLLA